MEVSIINDKRISLYVKKKDIPKIIGKGGKRIAELEKKIGLSINIDELDNAPGNFQKRLEEKAKERKSKKSSKKASKNSKNKNSKNLDGLDIEFIDEKESKEKMKDYSIKHSLIDELNHELKDYSLKKDIEDEIKEDLAPYYDSFELYPEFRDKHVILPIGKDFVGRNFDILIEDDYLFTGTIGRRGYVKINNDIEMAQLIKDAYGNNLRIIAKYRD